MSSMKRIGAHMSVSLLISLQMPIWGSWTTVTIFTGVPTTHVEFGRATSSD